MLNPTGPEIDWHSAASTFVNNCQNVSLAARVLSRLRVALTSFAGRHSRALIGCVVLVFSGSRGPRAHNVRAEGNCTRQKQARQQNCHTAVAMRMYGETVRLNISYYYKRLSCITFFTYPEIRWPHLFFLLFFISQDAIKICFYSTKTSRNWMALFIKFIFFSFSRCNYNYE